MTTSGRRGLADLHRGGREPETLGEMPVQFTRGVVVVGPVDQVAEIGPGLVRGLGPRQLADPEGRGIGDGGTDAAAPCVLE